MKKSKYNLGGLTALKDKIQGANPFPDLTKKERDAVMEAYTDGAIKEDGGLINDVPPMEVRNINLWLNDYSKYIPKESVEFSNLAPISLDDLNIKMSRVDRKEQQLENLLKEEPKAKTEADIDGSRIMDGRVVGGRGHWEGAVKDGFQVYNNEQQYIMESTIKDFAMVLNNAEVWIESTDEYRDLEQFVKHYNIFLDHIKENPQSKEAEFLNKNENEEPKEEPIEEEPFVPRVERSGKWDESYSILCDELATYEMGGVIKTEIDEYGSNVPKALQEVFDQFDEDADAYVEAERLRMKANEIGYDFDYGLSGEPTDFWNISDNYKKGGLLNNSEESDFNKWIEDGNAFEQSDNVWVEQTTQYRKQFTLDELKTFFKKEFRSYAEGGEIGYEDKVIKELEELGYFEYNAKELYRKHRDTIDLSAKSSPKSMARALANTEGHTYAKGGSTSKKSCYTKELKYKDGGMIFTFEEGGEISDTCYVNYEGYQIQSTRCKREGITYFMIGEYPEVAKALYKNYTSEWIYYNRLARLFVSPETAKQFVEEASKFFNPIVPIEPYFLDVDRSFATYSVRDTRPFQDVPISVSVGKSTTARKLGDKIQERKREEIRLKRIETLKTQGKPFFKEDDYRKAEGKYWAISTIISLGGEGDWGDDKWKNAITRENIPYDNGISLMTLIHEYAHCLDFNQSIAKGRIYERPIYELELLSGRNSIGQKFSSQEMKSMREAQQSGRKRTTLLSNHKEYFIQALSDILRGGMSNGIPILNEIENEAHEIEKRVGGKAYADEQRKKVQEDFLLKMQKTIEKANKPSLSVKFPTQLKEYLSRTSANYILQLSQKEIDKKVGTELLPHISNFKDVVRENMAFNPTENAKLLKDLRKIEKDIKRLQERT